MNIPLVSQNSGKFFSGVLAGVLVSILWSILLTFLFSNLYIIGILFKPIPAELFGWLVWALAYARFLLFIWRHPEINFTGYILGSAIPILFAVLFGTIVCSVRAPFRDGVEIIKVLEEYKRNHGNYPENIAQINRPTLVDDYYFDKKQGTFTLAYQTGLFESTIYESNTQKWRGDLPVGGVPYDILGIEQMVRDYGK